MKTKEPPSTERYARWCGRTVNKIIIYLLPDFDNSPILFQTADISLLLSNIVTKVCLFIISRRESAQLTQEIIESERLILMQFFL